MSSVAPSIAPAGAPAPEHQAAPGAARIVALDRLRGLALVAMVVHHMTDWLTGDARAVLPGWPSFAVTDVAAPAFFVAAGASASLFMAARRGRGMTRSRVVAEVLRRYGLLIPIGLAFDWLLWRHPAMFGVIEALGVTVVVGAGFAVAVGARWLPAIAAGTLAAGVLAERAVTSSAGWWADEVVAGKFPAVTYVGFVLVGMAAVRTGRFADRSWGLTAAALGAAAVALSLAMGTTPDRYPGGLAFVVPGLAGTAFLYALAQCGWPTWLGAAGRLIQSAAAHTLGIFLGHYVVYYVLVDRTGVAGTVPGTVALPVALLTAVALAAVAPRVPQLPWSPRTGGRRRPPVEPAAGGAAVTLPTR
jgi:surface polysaccharide O-acyltransferase-like enzyme